MLLCSGVAGNNQCRLVFSFGFQQLSNLFGGLIDSSFLDLEPSNVLLFEVLSDLLEIKRQVLENFIACSAGGFDCIIRCEIGHRGMDVLHIVKDGPGWGHLAGKNGWHGRTQITLDGTVKWHGT